MSVFMGNIRETQTDERHMDIFRIYEELIAEEGEKAKLFPKGHFYNLVADKIHRSPDHVQRVIRKMLKRKQACQG